MDQHDQGTLARDRRAKPHGAGVDHLQVEIHEMKYPSNLHWPALVP